MGRLWYIRHGQSTYNVASIPWHLAGEPQDQVDFQYVPDYIDCPLTETGRSQILENKDEILALPIDLVYVSPLLRALETCELIFEHALNMPKIVVNHMFSE